VHTQRKINKLFAAARKGEVIMSDAPSPCGLLYVRVIILVY
jgi:hypothetical protein